MEEYQRKKDELRRKYSIKAIGFKTVTEKLKKPQENSKLQGSSDSV